MESRQEKMKKKQQKKRIWKSQPGEAPITGPGDWLAMMQRGGESLAGDRRQDKGADARRSVSRSPKTKRKNR